MEFIISGIHFPISEEMKNYRYYRKLFSDLADQVASEFDALYTKQNHRLEDIIQNGSNQYAQCMYPVIQTALKCLAEKDILSYDAAGFWSKYGKYFNHWSEAYDISRNSTRRLYSMKKAWMNTARCAERQEGVLSAAVLVSVVL